jgi:hypothetical protein
VKPRIMYIERQAGALIGTARIGRVTFNRTGKTLYYRDRVFHRIVGGGFKSNYIEESTGEDYWISGCKRRGGGTGCMAQQCQSRSMMMPVKSIDHHSEPT